MSKCAKFNYQKFLKCTSKIGLNVNNAKHLEFFVSNLIPRNLQLSVFSGFMSTGIFLSNKILIGNLRKHLKNKNSYIKLVFPYLDYGLNYLFAEKNEINQYEKVFRKNYFIENAEIGKVFPSLNFEKFVFKNKEKVLMHKNRINSRQLFADENEEESKFKFIFFIVLIKIKVVLLL